MPIRQERHQDGHEQHPSLAGRKDFAQFRRRDPFHIGQIDRDVRGHGAENGEDRKVVGLKPTNGRGSGQELRS